MCSCSLRLYVSALYVSPPGIIIIIIIITVEPEPEHTHTHIHWMWMESIVLYSVDFIVWIELAAYAIVFIVFDFNAHHFGCTNTRQIVAAHYSNSFCEHFFFFVVVVSLSWNERCFSISLHFTLNVAVDRVDVTWVRFPRNFIRFCFCSVPFRSILRFIANWIFKYREASSNKLTNILLLVLLCDVPIWRARSIH